MSDRLESAYGVFEAKPGFLSRAFAAVFVITAVVICALGYRNAWRWLENWRERATFLGTAVLIIGVSLVLAIFLTRRVVRMDGEGIHQIHPFKKHRTIKWADVVAVVPAPPDGNGVWLTVLSGDGTVVAISSWVRSQTLKDIGSILLERVPQEIWPSNAHGKAWLNALNSDALKWHQRPIF